MFKMCVGARAVGRDVWLTNLVNERSPKNFNLEQRKIEQTYWNLQKRLHPDLYGSKSEVRLHASLPHIR